MVPKKAENGYVELGSGDKQLQTANSLYKYGMEILNNTSLVHKEHKKLRRQGKKPDEKEVSDVQEAINEAYDTLEESLLFGKDEAALALAKEHGSELGVKKDDHKKTLFISIAAKLGNKEGKNLLEQEQRLKPSIHNEVAPEAEKWAMVIQSNVKKYPNKDQEVTNEMIVIARKNLNAALESNKITAKMRLTHQPVAKINISASPPPTLKTPQKSKKTASCIII